ncbi:MAG: histidine phosphatase family protein [Candidatus Omnitrophica bacterium]|nr:histidine phosphatase family protein [Candidatus Omnitrophota bacterium]
MTRLILVRHGETDCNSKRVYCGASDPSLNEKGVWQAQRLAARLKDARPDGVYSSDLKRAYETAGIVFGSNRVGKLKDFREMDFGVFQGLRYDDIMEKYPALYTEWINNVAGVNIPGGESFERLRERVSKGLVSILSRHGEGTVALVSHGGPIRIILCEALGFGLEKFWEIKQDSCALNIIDYSKGSAPKVVKLNDISHLSRGEAAAS